MSEMNSNRRFMQCPNFSEPMKQSDQSKGIPAPPLGKPVTGELTVLPPFDGIQTIPLYADILDKRRSERKYSDKPLTQAQLAFMLWSAQGIQGPRGPGSFRPVPSGGARHPFETYVAVQSVEGLAPAIYHYLPTENVGEKRCTIQRSGELPSADQITAMLSGQSWAAQAPIVLFYSCVPYKAEWRYVETAHRVMLIDLGHVGQNAMLSAASLGLGSCCMAAYDQQLCDAALGVDGIDEYTVYVIAVGTPTKALL